MNQSSLCFFSLGLAVLSAETLPDATQTTASLPDPASVRFTPPPPPKEVPAMAVKASTSADLGTHRITILRGEPSTLPDIPEHSPPPLVEQSPEVAGEPVEPAEPSRMLFISGFAYADGLSHIQIWNLQTGTRHDAWCGWDVSLLAPFHEITHEGKSHTLFMFVSNFDASGKPDDDATRKRPEVKPGSILVLDGDERTAALLTSMRAVCLQNLPKLLALKAAREQSQKDSVAWKAANPPRPHNHTIWIKPHRGSRYLETTADHQKEDTR